MLRGSGSNGLSLYLPKGNRVPQALFKQGAAFQQMGDATAARILYERLVEKYPDSAQAQAAQKKLKQLQ